MAHHIARRSRRSTLLAWVVGMALVPVLVMAVTTLARFGMPSQQSVLQAGLAGNPSSPQDIPETAVTTSAGTTNRSSGSTSGSALVEPTRGTVRGSQSAGTASPYDAPADRDPTSASRSSGRNVPTLSPQEWEQRLLTMTNAARMQAGCPALKTDQRLQRAAAQHAGDMVANHYFSHTSPDGKNPTDRAKALGFPNGVGENIAVGYATADAVMHGWLASKGHRENILNCDYTVIGIGYDPGAVLTQYGPGSWVQMFGTL